MTILTMPKDSPSIRGTTPQIEQAAQQLRQNLTSAEASLWNALRRRQLLGLKFRCQHPVGQFIVDFYCPSCKLVIEVEEIFIFSSVSMMRQEQSSFDRLDIGY